MVGAIVSGNRWFLLRARALRRDVDRHRPVHGLRVGPILRQRAAAARREVIIRARAAHAVPDADLVDHHRHHRLVSAQVARLPRRWLGREFGWVVAALVLVTLMTVQGTGFLLPTNLWVCLELQNANPDLEHISHLLRFYVYMTALQGAMQVLIIVIMARFVAGI